MQTQTTFYLTAAEAADALDHRQRQLDGPLAFTERVQCDVPLQALVPWLAVDL